MIPPNANAEFVCAMEDVLEVYTRSHDPAYPVVCLDEISKPLVAETRIPLPATPGQPQRIDLSTGQKPQSPEEILAFLGEVKDDVTEEIKAVPEEGLKRTLKGFFKGMG